MMRPVPLAAGAIVLAVTWVGPLPDAARGSFAAHMTLHIIVVAIAAPLLAFGLAVRPSRLLAPIPASLLELLVVWTWHAPALHHMARAYTAAFVLEQATFLGTGVFLWVAAIGGDIARRGAAGVVALVFTSMHMTLLGALFALTPRPLYRHDHSQQLASALSDQHLGGVIMLLVGGASYLAGGLWLMFHVLKEPSSRTGTAWFAARS